MNHPFLICQKSQYNLLQERASQSPYKDFIEEARRVVQTLTYEPGTNTWAQGTRIRDIMGSSALLYIIEPDQQDAHRQRITHILEQWPAYTKAVAEKWDAGGNRWHATVPTSSAFFNTVLALDVIHDDLSDADRTRYETSLQEMVEWFWATMRGWGMATFGPRAIWAAYKEEDRLDEAMQQYRDAVFDQMTPDGVGVNGPEYSHARLNGERTAKYGFMHVAEYTGLDKSFYKDFRLKWYYEWLFSAGCTPFNTFVTFGDSGHGRGFNTFYPQSGTWAAGKFSPLAAEYAANRIDSAQPRYPSDLLAYCIADPLPKKRTPQSRLWNDGGALFYEKNDTEDALFGALWNVSTPSHGHKDANAIYLAGYGEHLLLNSGYNGYGNASKDFPWTYINDTAESSNTLLINGQNHLEKGSDGLIEGLLTDGIQYANGLAKRAFEGNSQHKRAFIFIPPQNNAPGYYLLIDNVENTDQSINLALHPASANVVITRPNEEYSWNVKSRKETDTFLTLYLATKPQSVELKDGVFAGWGKCFVGKYLYATYQSVPIITVLFPHNASHHKATMTRTDNGVTIQHHPNITDTATHNSILRQIDQQHEFYFAKQSTHFQDGNIGFTANEPITLFMRGKTGHVVSPGTNITFHHPNVTQVTIDGEKFVTESVLNGIRVTVPQGTCKIELG
jgi:hypothetical protein